MDLITDLPPADRHDSILVVVDQGLSKGVILIPCNKTLTSEGTARLLLENLYKWFGVFAITVNERDTIRPIAFGPVPSFATTARKSDTFEWNAENFEETFESTTRNIIIALSATSLDILQPTVLPFFRLTTK